MTTQQMTTRPWREAAALLIDAEASLRTAWVQGEWRSGDARCLVAALDDAAWSAGTVPAPLTASWSAPAYLLAREIIADELGRTRTTKGLTSWNDSPDTTADQVLAVVQSAATAAGANAELGESFEAVRDEITNNTVRGDRTVRTTDAGSRRLAALHTFGDWWVDLADLGPGPTPAEKARRADEPGYELIA